MSQKWAEPIVRKGKRSLFAFHAGCKYFIETTRNSLKIKLGINVKKFLKSLIGWKVIVTVTGRGSECHLTFVGGRLHIA